MRGRPKKNRVHLEQSCPCREVRQVTLSHMTSKLGEAEVLGCHQVLDWGSQQMLS